MEIHYPLYRWHIPMAYPRGAAIDRFLAIGVSNPLRLTLSWFSFKFLYNMSDSNTMGYEWSVLYKADISLYTCVYSSMKTSDVSKPTLPRAVLISNCLDDQGSRTLCCFDLPRDAGRH